METVSLYIHLADFFGEAPDHIKFSKGFVPAIRRYIKEIEVEIPVAYWSPAVDPYLTGHPDRATPGEDEEIELEGGPSKWVGYILAQIVLALPLSDVIVFNRANKESEWGDLEQARMMLSKYVNDEWPKLVKEAAEKMRRQEIAI